MMLNVYKSSVWAAPSHIKITILPSPTLINLKYFSCFQRYHHETLHMLRGLYTHHFKILPSAIESGLPEVAVEVCGGFAESVLLMLL